MGGSSSIPIVDDVVDWVDDNIIDPIDDFVDDSVDWVDENIIDPIGDLGTDVYDALEDAYDYLEDSAKDIWDASSSFVEATYTLQREMYFDAGGLALKGDFDESLKSIGKNIQKSGDAYIDFYRDIGKVAIDFNPYFRQADLLGSDSMYSTGYMKDVVEGSAALGHAALHGDSEAALALAVMAASVYFAYGTAAAPATSFMPLAPFIANVAFMATVYSILDNLRTIGILSKRQYVSLVNQASKMERQAEREYLSNMTKWMAGGDLFNSIYAGGELFNETGSRAQSKFLKNPDPNMNNVLAMRLGSLHNPYRKLRVESVGTDEFDVRMFSAK